MTEDYEPSNYRYGNERQLYIRLGTDWVSAGEAVRRFEMLEVRVKQLEEYITAQHAADALKW